MRKLFFTISILLLALSCKAQTLPIDTPGHLIEDDSYVKDLNNELNNFVGTQVYTNGNINFTVTIQKLVHSFNGDYYEDYLIGEYAYTLNGLTIINTLSNRPDESEGNTENGPDNINNVNVTQNIGGRYLVTRQDLDCPNCGVNERRIGLYFVDPERKYLHNRMNFRYMEGQTNPEKITIIIKARSGAVIPEDGFEIPRVPYGTYLMEKQ